MKKYHFFVTPSFMYGWLVLERGKVNHFSVCFPTKYRAQMVAKWLWTLWKKQHPQLENIKMLVCSPAYCQNWERLKNLMLAYSV